MNNRSRRRRSLALRYGKYFPQKSHTKKFPKLKKDITIKVQEAYKALNRLDQKRNLIAHNILKNKVYSKERMLKATR